MGALRTIFRNIVSNAAGYLVAVATALAMTPFVVHTLGKEVYGIWSLVVSLTGYYGVLDLGIRSAVGQYVTRYWAQRDMEGVNRTISTAVALTLPIAAVLLIASLLIAWAAPSVFDLKPEDVETSRTAILIMGASVALSFPFAIFGSATYARQRFDVANFVGISERLLHVGLAYWVLSEGYGLIGIAIVTAATQAAAWCMRVVVAFRLLPGLTVALRFFSRASARELWNFGLYNFLINIADRIVLSTDLLLIGIVMPDKDAVTYYGVGGDFIGHFMMIVNAVAWTLTPYATSCDATGDRSALQRLWISGSKNIFMLAALIGGGLIFLGHDFLLVWMDAEVVSGEKYTSSATILAVLAAATLLRALMTCGKQILFGMREMRFLAGLSVLEAIANLGLSIALIYPFGLLGVALGTLIPITCTQLVMQPRFLARRLGLSLRNFFTRVVSSGLVMLVVMGVTEFAVEGWIVVDGWSSFLLKALVVTAPALVIGWVFGVTSEEKHLVLRKFGMRK